MKAKEKLLTVLLPLGILLLLSLQTVAQQSTLLSRALKDTASTHQQSLYEQSLRYSKNILVEDIDFQLSPVSEGKFAINFSNNSREEVFIKVYDIIGNVLFEEKTKVRGNDSKQIDLSQLKTNFFIVEIKNEKFNKVKSIVAS